MDEVYNKLIITCNASCNKQTNICHELYGITIIINCVRFLLMCTIKCVIVSFLTDVIKMDPHVYLYIQPTNAVKQLLRSQKWIILLGCIVFINFICIARTPMLLLKLSQQIKPRINMMHGYFLEIHDIYYWME